MMTTQAESVLLTLRALILEGRYAPGEQLMEMPLADTLGVSRTPVRLALAALAQEGLLVYAPQRGFSVRGFTVKEVIDAVGTRGHLEAMAAGVVATRGLTSQESDALAANLESSRQLLRSGIDPEALRTWCGLNEAFHDLFVNGSDNEFIVSFCRKLAVVPLVSPKTIAATSSNFSRMIEVISRSLTLHEMIAEAAASGDPVRTETLMREHVHQGRERLRKFLETTAVVPGRIAPLTLDATAVAQPAAEANGRHSPRSPRARRAQATAPMRSR